MTSDLSFSRLDDRFSASEHAQASTPSVDRIALMQTFVRIVEAGSLSAAAVQMKMTQPTVSRRLQQLERSLGQRLLQRSTHAMKLTDEGMRCFERAKELLANWDAFEMELRGVGAEPEGNLRIVAPHAFGQQHLIGPLALFMKRYPKVSIEWLLHDRAPDFIADGVDCAIQVGEMSDLSVVAIRLAAVPRIVVAAPSLLEDRPPILHPEDLAQLPWLALHQFYRKEVSLTHQQTGQTHRVGFRPRMGTDSLFAVRNAAILGLGVCLASAWLLDEDLAANRLVPLLPDWQATPLPVYLVYPYARFYPAKLRRFVEVIRQNGPFAVGGAGDDGGEMFPFADTGRSTR